MRTNLLLRLGILAGVACAPSLLWGQFPNPVPIPKIAVTTYHYDNFRTGWNSHELVLNPGLQGKSPFPTPQVLEFGLLRQVTLDDTVYAQPLVVPDVAIAGGKHDVVYVATENNTVYAIDADSGEILLTRNLGPAVPRDLEYCANNGPHVGIESTPVIDSAHNAMYLISYIALPLIGPIYLLHNIDITTLKDQPGSPITVSATHKMTDGSTLSFNAADHRQRAALLFEDGNVYAAFSSWCDRTPARGWLLGWRATDLQLLAANFLTNASVSASNKLSTIWMSGYGPAAVAGHLYFTTGNSPDATGTSRDDTYSAPHNLSEGVVKVSAGLLHLLDFFTPSDVDNLNHHDIDLGSGGVLLLPDQPGNIPHLAIAAGKDGRMFLLNRDDMGGFSLTNNHVLGTYWIGACWCGQSYYLNNVVSSGGHSIGVWQINSSPSPSLTQVYSSSDLGQWRDGGFFTAISSDGNNNVIIWAVSRHFSFDVGTAPPTLFAFQAIAGNSQLQQLFSSPAGNWDVPHSSGDGANSNIVPVVANGHVYVASYKELDIFGLGARPVILHPAPHAVVPSPRPQPATGVVSAFGTITKLEGSRFTLKTEAGEVQVNAENAITEGLSPALAVGLQVSVYGDRDPQGVLHAEVIRHGLTPKSRVTSTPPANP